MSSPDLSSDEVSTPEDEFGISTDLPSPVLENLWNSLVFEYQLIERLLNYINTIQYLDEKGGCS